MTKTSAFILLEIFPANLFLRYTAQKDMMLNAANLDVILTAEAYMILWASFALPDLSIKMEPSSASPASISDTSVK